MRFLITGGRGFAAPHLRDRLIADGHSAYATHTDVTIKGGLFKLIKQSKIDGIFNLAAKTHPPTSFDEPEKYFSVNCTGVINIIQAITKYHPHAVLMQCSTSEVYGIHPEGTHISENTPCIPPNPYAVGKYAADLYIQERCTNGMLKAFITRAFSHTGPGRPPNYSISSDAIQIAKILKRNAEPVIKVGNLKCKRVVMDVRDVVGVYANLMYKYLGQGSTSGVSMNGQVYNIGGDNLHSIGFYLYKMLSMYGLRDIEVKVDPLLFRKFDIPVQYPDSNKVRKLLGWKPNCNMNKTLKDLVEYWKERV
ncbi:MAG: NAD-dependent epimerase/dehydratase family protein [Lentisphaerae bacterium]|nr:NAD-dependent epimerase/dehydratase family protein [Lentisphaerota bacterium]